MTEFGLTETIGVLRAIREELDACSVVATFSTRHGEVEVGVGPDGHVLRVNGIEVPQAWRT